VPDVVEPPPCPAGQHRDAAGNCVPDVIEPPPPCPQGQHRDAAGNCVPDVIEPPPCPAGQHRDAAGNCVPDVVEPPPCPAGQHRDAAGNCVPDEPPPPEPCPAGQHRDAAGNCVPDAPPSGGGGVAWIFSGAGASQVNGRYVQAGQVYGQPAFQGPGTMFLEWNGNYYYVRDTQTGQPFYGKGSTDLGAANPPWFTMSAPGPGPTVVQE
jgi:hypothetical protein